MPSYAKLRDDLVSSPVEIDGETHYTIKDPVAGGFFRLRSPEFWLIGQLDGETSPDEVARRFNDKFGMNLGAEQVIDFIGMLEKLFFLENSRSEQEISRGSHKAQASQSLFGRLLFIRLTALKPGRILEWLVRLYRPLHRPFWLLVALCAIAMGVGIVLANIEVFTPPSYAWLFSLGSLGTVIASLFLLIVFHEFAHAVVCRYYGGQVNEIGFLLLYFQPCFYCNVSDAWLFPNRMHRLAVTMAGPFFQMLLTAGTAVLWRITVEGTFINEVARITTTVSWITYFFNFNPLIKLDGYYLLSDWLEIPNLRAKAFAYLGNVCKRHALGWPIEKIEVTARERKIFLTYAILALFYSTFLLGFVAYYAFGFMLGLFGGFGLLLLLAIILFILRDNIRSLIQGTITHVKNMRRLLKQPIRLTIHLAIIAAVIVVVTLVPVPHRVSGDVVVRPIAEFRIAMNAAGLIETTRILGGVVPDKQVSILQMTSGEMAILDLVPMVKDGNVVATGDTLALLTSNQVVQELKEATAELERLEGKLSLLRAPPKKEEIHEAEARVTSARATLDKAQNDFTRTQGLFSKGLTTSEQIENARSSRDIAEANLQKEQSALSLLKSPPRPEEETVLVKEIEVQRAKQAFLKSQGDAQAIVSPLDGVVSRNSDDKEILSVINHQLVELLVPVSDFDITRIEKGQPVSVKVRSFPHDLYTGIVVRIPEAATTRDNELCFMVSVVVDNANGSLRNGMTGYAKIRVGDTSLAQLLYSTVLSKLRVEFWSWW